MFQYTTKGSIWQDGVSVPRAECEGGPEQYYRRPDVSWKDRYEIALAGLDPEREWGTMTRLARVYGLSRQRIYEIVGAAGVGVLGAVWSQAPGRSGGGGAGVLGVGEEQVERAIVTMDVVLHGSVRGIQEGLREILGVERSVGYIEGVLQGAEAAAGEQNRKWVPQGPVWGLADEVFVGGRPYLTLADGRSLVWLLCSPEEGRDEVTWGVRLLEWAEGGVRLEGVTCDAGKGLRGGIAAAELVEWVVADVFHPLRAVGQVAQRVEREAYRAMGEEYERERVFLNRQSERALAKQLGKWEDAVAEAEEKMRVSDLMEWLARELAGGLGLVEWTEWRVRRPEELREHVEVVAELMKELGDERARKVAERLEEEAAGLAAYLEVVWVGLEVAGEAYGSGELVEACAVAWWLEDHRPAQLTGWWERAWEACRERLEGWEAGVVERVGGTVGEWLGWIWRASSGIELIHNWLRPHLHVKRGQIDGRRELLRWRWNTHRFARGKRAGQSPLEIAGVRIPGGDWLAALGLGEPVGA